MSNAREAGCPARPAVLIQWRQATRRDTVITGRFSGLLNAFPINRCDGFDPAGRVNPRHPRYRWKAYDSFTKN
jgi:hypothetical protein